MSQAGGQAGGLNGLLCDGAYLTAFVLADGPVPCRAPSTGETILCLNHHTGFTHGLSVLSKVIHKQTIDLQIEGTDSERPGETETGSSCGINCRERNS